MSLFRKLFPASRREGVQDILLHCHLFKNAGTTIDDAFKRSFGRAFYDHRDDSPMRKQGMEYVEQFLDEHSRVRIVSSHHMPFDPQFRSGRYRFKRIVMLRDPIDRAGSVHAYEVKQRKGSIGAEMAASMNIREYFEWRLSNDAPAVLRSYQVRYLAGHRNARKPVTAALLEKAGARLADIDTCVGIVERFDESMVVMEHVLRDIFPELDLAHVVKNRNREGSLELRRAALRQPLGEDLFSRLEEINSFDNELYTRADKALDAAIRDISDFDVRLEEYRRRCAGLS